MISNKGQASNNQLGQKTECGDEECPDEGRLHLLQWDMNLFWSILMCRPEVLVTVLFSTGRGKANVCGAEGCSHRSTTQCLSGLPSVPLRNTFPNSVFLFSLPPFHVQSLAAVCGASPLISAAL